MPDFPIIDPEVIESLRALNTGDNDDFLREITGLFLADTPERLRELDQSLAAGDRTTFIRAAHSIKGSSANLGIMALHHAAERVEAAAKDQGLAAGAALLPEIRAEFARAQEALKKLFP